ncbi:MAG: hypothetical protein JXB26_07965 [Candidatus Aminicenantes bacterium]|nr:hypothetical protein [Candidatus Aminicenantes bacterium]
MRKKVILILPFVFLIGACLLAADVSIIRLDELKPGMKGRSRSVFKGTEIEEFNLEILGVLRNVEPKRSVVLARLEGPLFEKAGVQEGMSGSPVYIDGKLAGAIAYSFPFAKEPIAGITPIEEMLSIREKESPKSEFSPRLAVRKDLSLEEMLELNQDYFRGKAIFYSHERTITPLSVPMVFSGYSAAALDKTRAFFKKMGFNPISSGTVSRFQEKASKGELTVPQFRISPGDPIGAQLVTGDLNVGAVGTVTYVDGNNILAFGHPLFNLGSVDYAMTRAEIITVVPSLSTSFKMAVTDNVVGRIVQDRSSGVYGELAKKPHMIPINVNLYGEGDKRQEFEFKVVDDKLLSPVYISMSLQSLLPSEQRSFGDLTVELNGEIYLENGSSIHLEDFFSGNYDSSLLGLSNLVGAVVYYLVNNEFEDLNIYRIDLNIKALEEARFAYLEKIWLEKYEVSPGEYMRMKIFYRTFRGESLVEDGGLLIPNLPGGSQFYVIVADAASMQQIEMSHYQTSGFMPRSLNQLLRILGNLRKNNRIYIKILASKPGLFLKGEELPNLPPTMKSMFSSSRAASAPRELNRSTLSEYQKPLPYVFQGSVIVPVKIKE